MNTRPTPTVEDYLGVIYILERDGEVINSKRLVDWIGVSAPTVTATVKRMMRDGWIVVDAKKLIHLTAAGRAAAASLLRRHMLLELLLTRVLDVPWSQTHEEAHRIEHTISEDTLTRMLAQFEDASTCPHGNPLPGQEAAVQEWRPLSSAPLDQVVWIKRVHESIEEDAALMAYLEKQGIVPGAAVTVREILPFNQTLGLEVNDSKVVLGDAVARRIFAAPEEQP
ncbi:MAG: Iron-dependent repressor IdeR [Chloroflexi bacterium ADurb.Bin325]|nr:MAG: Iron-dependent repressor IdeR [Chloroflexi bacterium ADurb.Bin325]